jgi:DNA invertase Pin-like site-specific DNA recombinase
MNQWQNMRIIVVYCHVSMDDQDLNLCLAASKQAGHKQIFTDDASGVMTSHYDLTRCLKALIVGSPLIVRELDRLGRSRRNLLGLPDDLKARGVAFQSLTETIGRAQAVAHSGTEESR